MSASDIPRRQLPRARRIELWLFVAQRATAALLAPLLLIHLVTIMVAIRGGLSAEEILGRTQGSLLWGAFYSLFFAAAGIHGAIGLRAILREWTPWRGHSLDAAAAGFALAVLLLGSRAVSALV